jgi:hypothetical protein
LEKLGLELLGSPSHVPDLNIVMIGNKAPENIYILEAIGSEKCTYNHEIRSKPP